MTHDPSSPAASAPVEHPIVASGTMPAAATVADPAAPGPGLSLPDLEAMYDALADAIDRAGPQASERMLVKLALLGAQALGDRGRTERLIEQALADL